MVQTTTTYVDLMERTGEDSVGLSTFLGPLQSSGLSTVPGDLKEVQWRHGNSDGKPGHECQIYKTFP